MATTITTSADDSFEGRLKARLKESIGDLVTDQDLSNLVNRSLEEIFFTERKNPKRGYYNMPSFISAWAYLATNRPLLPVPISHYQP